MDRRESIKTLALGAFASGSLLKKLGSSTGFSAFESSWHKWPDMEWAGPEYWGNRLQDWRIREGKVECLATGKNRSLHSLTHQLGAERKAFETAVALQLLNANGPNRYAGFRLGATGRFNDYRSAAVFGKGLDAGITGKGRLFIGDQKSSTTVATGRPVYLLLEARPQSAGYEVVLKALDEKQGQVLAELTATSISNKALTGNIALVSHSGADSNGSVPSARFSRWALQGEKFIRKPNQSFGPICFAQYTLHDGTLKLTAQLAPIEQIRGHKVVLEVKESGRWKVLEQSAVDPLARIARFRVEDWDRADHTPYRIRLSLPLRSGSKDFFYRGTVAQEPSDAAQLKAAVFSCNFHHGFPDADVVENVKTHRPDIALFLGDQFYEGTGGFGIQKDPLKKSALDYLHKWYMFGWSYRDLFRDIPAAVIPDDHDVYHGNVWGESGKKASTDQGWGYNAQDSGGYKMPATWVNMVQRTQTSHLPDPYDSTPVKQGIGVYYTRWNYGGIDFAILEDRKFKSAPKSILPEKAQVANGFVTNPEFDIRSHRNWPEAELLGRRQRRFVEEWSTDWSGGAQMKAVLSQTNFCAVHTLPKGSTGDQEVPSFPIPAPGEYVEGDAPIADMDTNGWPQNRRDEVVGLLRKGFAFHIAGDQHLGTVVQYGVDEFDDAGYVFTGPALNNIWPRRWWPPVEKKQQALANKPAYTGSFFDGFGNRITVHAVANPRKTGRKPSIIYDRSTGYGIVNFNKEKRTIRIECWPRHADPAKEREQYGGWPVTIRQEDNYSRPAKAWLPTVKVEGLKNPVVEVVDESSEELVYALRIQGQTFQPKVFKEGRYALRVGEPDKDLLEVQTNLEATAENSEELLFRF